MDNEQKVGAVEVIIALADMASKGKYDNVTPEAARQMNAIFDATAELINQLEEAEKNLAEANMVEAAKQDAAAILMDEEVEGDNV
jgi:hypothetical protein